MPGQNVRIGSTTSSPKVGGPVDADGEVICPLLRPDGRVCSKKCTGERRFRSMQEHIRRAHPDDYLPRLAATKESFLKMITSAKKRNANGEQIFNITPSSSAGGAASYGTPYSNSSNVGRGSNVGGSAPVPTGTIRATTPTLTPTRSRKPTSSTPTMASANGNHNGAYGGGVGAGGAGSSSGHKRTKSGGWGELFWPPPSSSCVSFRAAAAAEAAPNGDLHVVGYVSSAGGHGHHGYHHPGRAVGGEYFEEYVGADDGRCYVVTAGFRDEIRYEKRIEDMSPPSTSSDANDLPTINVSLATMGGRPSMDDLFRAVDESMSDDYKSESGSDTPRSRGRKTKRRKSNFEEPYGDGRGGLAAAKHSGARGPRSRHITPKGASRQIHQSALASGGSNEDDADRTLEMEDDQSAPEMEAIRRWDELVMAATSATGVEVSSSSVSSSHLVTSSAPEHNGAPAPTTIDITPPPQSIMGGNSPPSQPRDRLPSVPSVTSSHNTAPTSARNITISYTPKVECSSCGKQGEMQDSYACPECISGVCKDCVLAMNSKKPDARTCPCCNALGVVFKVIRIVIR